MDISREFIEVSQIQFRESFDSDKRSKWPKKIPRVVCKIQFLIDVVFGVAVVASFKLPNFSLENVVPITHEQNIICTKTTPKHV